VDEGQPIAEVFRRESGQVLATLIRFCGDFDLAEDAVQDTFLLALERWSRDGVPPNPGAWITAAAKHRAIDRIRREARRVDKEAMVSRVQSMPDDPAGLEDDQLRLIFTCCHPALAVEAQVALTLRTLAASPPTRSPVPSWCRSAPWRSGWCGRNARSEQRESRSGCHQLICSMSASTLFSPLST